jgi:hypothetical protein
MSRSLLRLDCPCCGRPIEIDTRSGKARSMRTGDAGLEDLLDKHKGESSRLADAFEAARQEHAHEDERLDELFRDAREKAKDDDSKPRSPFDLE